MCKFRKPLSGKTGTYTLESDFRGHTQLATQKRKREEGRDPKMLCLLAPQPLMVWCGWSQSWQWSSHWGTNAPGCVQKLSKGYVGAVSIKGADFHVLTFQVYLTKMDLLENLPVIVRLSPYLPPTVAFLPICDRKGHLSPFPNIDQMHYSRLSIFRTPNKEQLEVLELRK